MALGERGIMGDWIQQEDEDPGEDDLEDLNFTDSRGKLGWSSQVVATRVLSHTGFSLCPSGPVCLNNLLTFAPVS